MMNTTKTRISSRQLREAAERIARRRHPDQTVGYVAALPTWFDVRMSGGSVLVGRQEAQAEARRARS